MDSGLVRQIFLKALNRFEYALDRAHQYAQSAKAALRSFQNSEDKETLALVADFVVDRDR